MTDPVLTPTLAPRAACVQRRTRETQIDLALTLDAPGDARDIAVRTGLGFLDHMLVSLATHARWGLTLTCTGDLHVDDHHTAEDCALALGEALDLALADRSGITRFAHAYAPLDEALARVVVDLVRRPSATIDLALRRERLGDLAAENIPHIFRSLAMAGRFTLHADVLRGENDHHRAEAAFKALALALRAACAPDPSLASAAVPSTKGIM